MNHVYLYIYTYIHINTSYISHIVLYLLYISCISAHYVCHINHRSNEPAGSTNHLGIQTSPMATRMPRSSLALGEGFTIVANPRKAPKKWRKMVTTSDFHTIQNREGNTDEM